MPLETANSIERESKLKNLKRVRLVFRIFVVLLLFHMFIPALVHFSEEAGNCSSSGVADLNEIECEVPVFSIIIYVLLLFYNFSLVISIAELVGIPLMLFLPFMTVMVLFPVFFVLLIIGIHNYLEHRIRLLDPEYANAKPSRALIGATILVCIFTAFALFRLFSSFYE